MPDFDIGFCDGFDLVFDKGDLTFDLREQPQTSERHKAHEEDVNGYNRPTRNAKNGEPAQATKATFSQRGLIVSEGL